MENSVVYKLGSVKHSPSRDTWEALANEDPNYASLAIHWRREAVKERFVYIVGGLAPEDRTLCTNDADVMTTCAAIAERMIYAKINGRLVKRPGMPVEHYRDILGKFRDKVVRAAGSKYHPVTPEEFVESYKGRKRTIYASYLDEFISKGVSEIHARFKTFMKVEKVPTNKSPRTIQPRSPIFNIGLGRFLKHKEKPIFRAIAKVFKQDIVVFKGLNANQAGQEMRTLWERFNTPVAVGLDASRFDASVDEGMLRFEHSLYNALFQDKELARLLKMQLKNVGVAYCYDGKIKYTVSGGRGSGDMNTSLGNSFIMCAIVWCWLQKCGVNACLANNGDDCVVIMESGDLEQFSLGFDVFAASCGFTMVVEEPVYEFEQIEFCQTHPILVGGEWRMVRNFTTAREKDSMCLFPLDNAGALQSWLYAVGECGLALCSGVPVMQEMYTAMMRSGRPSNMSEAVFMQSGSRMMSIGMESKRVPVSEDARYSFYVAFGVTPDEQVAMEEYYSQWAVDAHVQCVDELLEVAGTPL